jgi:hypothetical protein
VSALAVKRTVTNLSANFSIVANAGGIELAQANLSVVSTQSTQINATRSGRANLPVIASQLTAAIDTNRAQVALSAQFTLVADVSIINIDPDLTYIIPKEIRSQTIAEELRDDIVMPELRSYTVIKEIRGYSVLNTEEEYII